MKQWISVIMFVVLISSGCRTSSTTETTNTTQPYSEQYRPQFHYTALSQWMNDPNGLVYFDGEYHLFYQHNPDSTVWGPMHWGHAVSTDLIHWQQLPIALYPDSLGAIFSGSAVIDWKNTTGLGTEKNPAMVAVFTHHNMEKASAGDIDYQVQSLAYSVDKGRTWKKYAHNPVLSNPGVRDFRDPKVMWDEGRSRWLMALAVNGHIRFYSSSNLKQWTYESDFGQSMGAHGGVWECPDLFKLKVAGSDVEKWVLLVSINGGGPNGGTGTQYFVGEFDGRSFSIAANETKWLDYGKDNYAGVTWSDIPEADGRRLMIGWMSDWEYANVVPTDTWRNAMTIPRELRLTKQNDGYLLQSNPVKELSHNMGAVNKIEGMFLNGDKIAVGSVVSGCQVTFHINATIAHHFGLRLSNAKGEYFDVGYRVDSSRYFMDRSHSGDTSFSKAFAGIHFAPRLTSDSTYDFRLLVDVASAELFADNGTTVMTDIFFPSEKFSTITIFNDAPVTGKIEVQPIDGVWK